jgi:hypothetical protein
MDANFEGKKVWERERERVAVFTLGGETQKAPMYI